MSGKSINCKTLSKQGTGAMYKIPLEISAAALQRSFISAHINIITLDCNFYLIIELLRHPGILNLLLHCWCT